MQSILEYIKKTHRLEYGVDTLTVDMSFSDFIDWLKMHRIKKMEINFSSFADLRDAIDRNNLVEKNMCVVIYNYDKEHYLDKSTVCDLYPKGSDSMYMFSFYKGKLISCSEERRSSDGTWKPDRYTISANNIEKINNLYR